MDLERFNDYISQGISLMSSENYASARKEFEKALNINKRSVDAYTHLGNACASMGDYDEAIMAFRNVLTIDNTKGDALYSIGNLYLLKNERLKAVEFYNKAENVGFKRVELYHILARIFYDAGDVVQALRNITKAIAIEPFNGNLRLFKVRIYLTYEKYEEAMETLSEMQKILPDAFEVYDLQSQILCAQEKYEDALVICDEGYSRFPHDENLALNKLKVLIQMKKDDSAQKFIAEMKEKGHYEKVYKDAVSQEVILYLRKNDANTSITLLKEADIRLKNDADIKFLLMDIYGKSGQYKNVLEMAEEIVKLDTNYFYDSTARYFYAFALDKLGNRETANIEYKKLTSSLRKLTIKNPSFYEGYMYRLLCHTKLGEFEKAFELAEYMEAVYPDRPDAHMFRYYIYKEQGKMEEAEEEKSKALEIKPDLKI